MEKEEPKFLSIAGWQELQFVTFRSDNIEVHHLD
jgi:hypothetical protein